MNIWKTVEAGCVLNVGKASIDLKEDDGRTSNLSGSTT